MGMWLKYDHEVHPNSCSNTSGKDLYQLGFYNLASAFLVLLLANFLAVVILIGEKIWSNLPEFECRWPGLGRRRKADAP